jgi:hypothetical protein
VLCSFGGMPDAHEIRLEGGKLRFVHSMTVMRNLTAGLGSGMGVVGTD